MARNIRHPATSGREKYEIHHLEEIQNGGAVYDLDNMTITTPRNHIRIHSKGNL
ncbi:hypothetical protein [Marinobacter shengliensis]|uniref:hypothetical protein n=1 Tax=Marinobacter shengliensis TaxID=1389223 RepID=UPI0035B7F9E8